MKIRTLSTNNCHLDTKVTIQGLHNTILFYTFALEIYVYYKRYKI